jgi:hypothetical protein
MTSRVPVRGRPSSDRLAPLRSRARPARRATGQEGDDDGRQRERPHRDGHGGATHLHAAGPQVQWAGLDERAVVVVPAASRGTYGR